MLYTCVQKFDAIDIVEIFLKTKQGLNMAMYGRAASGWAGVVTAGHLRQQTQRCLYFLYPSTSSQRLAS